VSGSLERQQRASRRQDIGRLIVALVLLLAASGVWHAVRPAVTLALARSSIGCYARNGLLAGALEHLYPQYPVAHYEIFDNLRLGSYLLRAGSLVVWHSTQAGHVGAPESEVETRVNVADDRLRYLGSLRDIEPMGVRPEGFDARGGVTFVAVYEAAEPNAPSSDAGLSLAVLRFAPPSAEVAGLVVHDGNWLDWADTDADGTTEFVLGRIVRRRAQSPKRQYQVQAVFKLDDNGVLFPYDVPPDKGVRFWTPPDGRPVPIPADVSAEEFFRTLAPWPDGFSSPASAPPSAASE
jgi:hypothetical protein